MREFSPLTAVNDEAPMMGFSLDRETRGYATRHP